MFYKIICLRCSPLFTMMIYYEQLLFFLILNVVYTRNIFNLSIAETLPLSIYIEKFEEYIFYFILVYLFLPKIQ